jgi:hypothetical protein
MEALLEILGKAGVVELWIRYRLESVHIEEAHAARKR